MGNNFNAKGQIVFIEPTWVTGETCLYNINNKIEYARAKGILSKLRKEFIKQLENEGFIITYDKNCSEKDVIYFIMNNEALCDANIDIATYKKLFDKRILEAGGKNIHYPQSKSMEEFFKKPFFPAVLKNELANGGVDKFLIETKEQLEIIKKFYEKYKTNEEYRETFNCSIFQQLIETPTNKETYLRVLMSSTGEVMGASLKYSEISEKRREAIGLFEKHFWNPQSEYYLNCNGMFNYYSEGGNISFNQPRYSNINQNILKAHGIDPNSPSIPDEVIEVASLISQKCNKELGIICGFDFILNVKDNKWYYLENQSFPAIDEWAVRKGIKLPKIRCVEDYIKLLEIELITRHEALIMHAKKNAEKYEETPKKYELKPDVQ